MYTKYIRRTNRLPITFTRCAKHPPNEVGPSQPVARRTRHRGNEEEAEASHTQLASQTTLARGRDRGRGRRGIRRALFCLYN